MSSNYKNIKDKFQYILDLSKEICEKADWWYYKADKPLSDFSIKDNNIILPEEYLACLSLSNGFYVDFASTTGYFCLRSFESVNKFNIDEQRMFEKKIPFKQCIGWLNHQCIYIDVFTGEFFIEHKRYQYELINDWNSEILDHVIDHLETEIKRSIKGKKLLLETKDNPLRPMYDKLISFIKPNEIPDIKLNPPASEEEITQWEEINRMKLPADYRNWLKLSNGSSFGNKFILGLDRLRKVYKSEFINGVEYVYIVGLTGCFDYLLFNSQTGETCILTEDFELEEAGDFEKTVFLEEFEFMEENMD